MSSFVESIRFESMDQPLHLDRKTKKKKPDELDQLATSFNRMRENLARDVIRREMAEKELRESEERYRSLVENVPVAVYRNAPGLKGRFLMANPTFLKMFRLDSEEELKEMTVADLYMNPNERKVFSDNIQATGTATEVELLLKKKDETPFWGSVSARTIDDGSGKGPYFDCTIMDITDRKRAEEALNEYTERLEQMVEERTKDLESFAYSVSHDLRAPLRHMSGFTKMFVDHAGEGLDDKGRRYLDVVATSAELMGVLIDDLLQFSRTGRAELRMSQFDMGPLVKEAIDQLQLEIEGRNIEWKIGALPKLRADRAMMLLVLVNLISNAIKFTSPREKALIEISTGGDDEDETVFFVRDNGVGFDMKYVDKLFGVFQRLHRKEDFEGTGIGLANVKRIISRHNGRSWAEAEVDKGATIWFSLPK